jgi:WXG100 family type VII secretion target
MQGMVMVDQVGEHVGQPRSGARGTRLGMRFAEFDSLLAELSRTNAALDSTLTQFDRRLAAMRGGWAGAASDAYEDARRRWDLSMRRRRQMLERIRRAGTGIVDGHRDAADAVHRIWGA